MTVPAALALAAALAGCGGEPPEELGGFRLGLSQQEVMDMAGARGGFGCRLRASRPKRTLCEGPAEEGTVAVLVEGDSSVRVELRLEAGPEEPRGRVERFVEPFGDPAWIDRPVPPRTVPPEGYHTLWLDRDSLRALALVCAGTGLEPPCTAELTATSPSRVQAKLDTLLGIRR